MTLDMTQVLRLEVEVPADGLENLIPNPSGELGAWGWVTPLDNTSIASSASGFGLGGGPALAFSGPNQVQAPPWSFTSVFLPVTAGQWVAARFDVLHLFPSDDYVKVRYEWYDNAFSLISSSAQSAAITALGTVYVPSVQAPANTAFAKFRFDYYNSTGDPSAGDSFWFRNVMVTHNDTNTFSTVRTNLVPNPSFESNLTGWSSPTTHARSTTVGGYVGTAALKLTATTAGNTYATTDFITVNPGRDYAYQARFRAGTTGRSVVTMLEWYDSAQNFITSTGRNATDTAGSWVLSSNTMTAPTNAAYARVMAYVWSAPSGEVHYVDAVMLEESSTVGDYFDGSFSSSGTVSYSWTGTANNSASTETSTSFAFAAPSTWQNILGPSHEIKVEREMLNVGTLTATVLDANLDPAVADVLRPGKNIRLTTLNNDTDAWEPLYTGTLTGAVTTYDPSDTSNKRARVDLTAVDNIAKLANTAVESGVATMAELPFLLEGAGVPWNVDGSGNQVPTATVVSTNESASAVDQIAITRDTSLGAAWVDRFNVLQARSSDKLYYYSVLGVFYDDSDPSYTDIDVSFSTDECINEVNITWLRYNIGTEETTEAQYGPYRDADSIATWGAHSATFTIQGATESPTAIAAYAQQVLDTNAVPTLKVHSITTPVRYPEDIVLGQVILDLGDEIYINNEELSIFDWFVITGITHEITPDKWLVTYSFGTVNSVAAPQVTPSVVNNTAVSNTLSGEVKMYAGDTAPDGWLLCDGSSYSTSTYSSLFAVIGYTFGGSGSTFNVPDLTDRFPIGAGNKALGATGGSSSKTIGTGNLPSHTHSINHDHDNSTLNFQWKGDTTTGGSGARVTDIANQAPSGGGTAVSAGINIIAYSGNSGSTGSGNALDVMNPWLSINFIIRA